MGSSLQQARAARYHPDVIWGPFLLALVLGLIVSAGLYFAYLWPQVEPDEPDSRARATPRHRRASPRDPRRCSSQRPSC